MQLSSQIHKYRKAAHLTQEQLASELGVTPQSVSNWERGGAPDIAMLPVIANYFKISIDEGTNVVDYLAVIKKTDTVKPSHLGYTIELPRKGTLTLHIGVASYQEKSVTISEFDQSGISDITLLVDEDDEYLCDEDGNIFIDEE